MTAPTIDLEEDYSGDVESTTSYHGNSNLKGIGEVHNFTQEQTEEMTKCAADPIYFIENYCKIVSSDHGLVPFKLYECQKKKVRTIFGNRMVIIMEPRQNGKCSSFDTRINIRNKKDEKTYKIKIGDYYEWQRFCEWNKIYGASSL